MRQLVKYVDISQFISGLGGLKHGLFTRDILKIQSFWNE